MSSIGQLFQGSFTNAIGSLERSLPVDLTDQEVLVRAAELAAAHKDSEENKKKLKSITSDLKGKIEMADLRSSELARIVGSRQEDRPVKCYEIVRGSQVQVVRMDTYVVVEYRNATPADLQKPLFLEPQAKDEPGAPSEPEQIEAEPAGPQPEEAASIPEAQEPEETPAPTQANENEAQANEPDLDPSRLYF